MQFLPPDDEHMCSKHVDAWNKLNVKQNFCVSSWIFTEKNDKGQYHNRPANDTEAYNTNILLQTY